MSAARHPRAPAKLERKRSDREGVLTSAHEPINFRREAGIAAHRGRTISCGSLSLVSAPALVPGGRPIASPIDEQRASNFARQEGFGEPRRCRGSALVMYDPTTARCSTAAKACRAHHHHDRSSPACRSIHDGEAPNIAYHADSNLRSAPAAPPGSGRTTSLIGFSDPRCCAAYAAQHLGPAAPRLKR